MAPSIPDKIQCTSANDFASHLRDIQPILALPETEDNWEKISRAIQKLTALSRGGACSLDPDFANAIKVNYKPITASMITERTRLSGTALELVTAFAPRLGSRFDTLVPIIIPTVLKVLTRPNKVFVKRAQECLNIIVERCHLVTIVPFIREAAKDKSVSLRLGATEATLLILEHWDRSLLDVREGASTLLTRHRGNVEDIESIIQETARDANATIRQVSRALFEKYSEIWPERTESFTAPLSPTIRKYLNLKGMSSAAATKKPAPPRAKALPIDPLPRAEPHPALPAGPSRPVRPPSRAQTNPTPTFPSKPASRPQSRTDHADAPSKEVAPAPGPPARTRTISTTSRPHRPPQPTTRPEAHSNQEGPMRSTSRVGHRGEREHVMSSTSSSATSSSTASGPPSRPPSRAQVTEKTPAAHHEVPAAPAIPPVRRMGGGPPVRPGPLVINAISAGPTRGTMPMTATGVIRIQRPKADGPPPIGPVRPTARLLGIRDPPSRQARPEMADKGETAPKADIPSPPSDEVLYKAVITPLPIEDEVQEMEKLHPCTGPVESEAPASSVSAPTPPAVDMFTTPVMPTVNVRPMSALSTATNGSTAKRPAVLQKRAPPPPAGHTQSFAPNRKRAGLSEPTLSQLAKQKPAREFVPTMSKKTEASGAVAAAAAAKTYATAPAPTKKVASTIPPKKAADTGKAPTAKASNPPRKVPAPAPPKTPLPAPKPPPPALLPEEVQIAMEVPLPPLIHEEVPLPEEDEEDEIEEIGMQTFVKATEHHRIAEQVLATPKVQPPVPVAVSATPKAPLTELIEEPSVPMADVAVFLNGAQEEEDEEYDTFTEATPRAPHINRAMYQDEDDEEEEDQMIDWDKTALDPFTRARRSIVPGGGRVSIAGYDPLGDMSVILPADRFAPITPFAVLRDSPTYRGLGAPVLRPTILVPTKSKAKSAEQDGNDGRPALSEREINLLVAP